MKNITIFMFLITIFIYGCKKEESKSFSPIFPTNNNNVSNPNVPSGTIVPVDERFGVLTRTATSKSTKSESQFWKYTAAKALVNGCGESETIDFLEGYENDVIEIKFNTNYTLETRVNGYAQSQTTWSWNNESTKTGIILGNYPDVVFLFTMLNPTGVVYASNQNQSSEDCSNITVTTYEHLVASLNDDDDDDDDDNPPAQIYVQGSGVTDVDGNTYQTIILANGYEWMQQNLRTTKYANGSPIQNVQSAYDWEMATSGAWVHSFNNNQYEHPYGKLYNGHAVIDNRGICPTGWHVATYNDWQALISLLGGEDVAGGKLKSIGTQHWESPNTGATNASGFTALPGGNRNQYGDFFDMMSMHGFWWTSTMVMYNPLYAMSINAFSQGITEHLFDKNMGLSVRCVKN